MRALEQHRRTALKATCLLLRDEAALAIKQLRAALDREAAALLHRANSLEAWARMVEAEQRVVAAARGTKER